MAKTTILIGALALALSGMQAAEPERSGRFTRQDTKIAGNWKLVERDGRWHVHLSEDFKTRSAPDLKIFLSRAALDTVNGKNATRDAVLVAALAANKGGQSYPLPEGIDLTQFKSILIHCEKYSKLWGGAEL